MAASMAIPGVTQTPVEQVKNIQMNADPSNPVPNEGNWLSLLTMNSIIGKDVDPVIKSMAKEEARHLYGAMRIITGEMDTTNKDAKMAAERLREIYGRDMNAAITISKMLKARSDEAEVDMMLKPFVISTMNQKSGDRQNRGGWSAPTAVEGAYSKLWS
jgi:hypothetical protein